MRGMSATYVILSFLALAGFISACSKPKAKNAEAVNNGQASESQIAKPILVNQEGISFTVDAADYGQIKAERIKKEVFDEPMPAMAAPEHICIYLEDKRPLPAFEKGARYFFPSRSAICVFPLQDKSEENYLKSYTEIYIAAGQLIFLLERGINPLQHNYRLLLPDLWESIRQAGGSVVAKYSKQLFQSGEGVLLLTQYSQDMAPTPVNNEELTYNFQGITKDRKYYVAASFAVTNAALPKGIDFTRDS